MQINRCTCDMFGKCLISYDAVHSIYTGIGDAAIGDAAVHGMSTDPSRLKPTAPFDGNGHRNKRIMS